MSNRRIGAALLLLAQSACASESPAPQSLPVTDSAARFSYEVVARGLVVPWDISFAPDRRIFVTERPGRIRVIQDGQLLPEAWAVIPVVHRGEAGLMGIAVSPDFARDSTVFVVGAFADGARLVNRVLRIREQNGRGGTPIILIDNIPSAEFHAGDAIEFGPDGMLYIATGDAGDPGAAADPGSLAGKILRYKPDGSIPAENPFRGSPVYALGLRNVQGLAWHPTTRQLFVTDHGPSGFPNERFRRNNDELNAILPGQNYGWPEVAGADPNRQFAPPVTVWNPAIAPAGLAFYSGPAEAWQQQLFISGLRGQQLRRLRLEAQREPPGFSVIESEVLFHEQLGRIRAVVMGPDGNLYFSTSNRDGRGDPASDDDRVVRLVLPVTH